MSLIPVPNTQDLTVLALMGISIGVGIYALMSRAQISKLKMEIVGKLEPNIHTLTASLTAKEEEYRKGYENLTLQNRAELEKTIANDKLELERRLKEKADHALQLGINKTRGEITQLQGMWQVINEYDHIMIISTVSTAPSLDLLAISKDGFLCFLDFKPKGGKLTKEEKIVKAIVDQGHVAYKVIEVE
jgi:predicted Holliday junction resolvase-like endonuclease